MKIFPGGACFISMLFILILLSSCGTPDEKKMAFFSEGQALYDTGDYTRARLEFKNSIQIDPKFARGYLMLGKTEMKLKKIKQAYSLLRQAVKLAPELIDARLELGKILFSVNSLDQAEEQADEILKIAPGNMDAQIIKASVYLAGNDFKKTQTALDTLDQADVDTVELYLLQASYYKAVGKNMLAGEALFKGMRSHPKSSRIMMALAKYHEMQGDLEGVAIYLKKALEVSPEDAELKLNLAWIYLKTKKMEKALALLNKIIDDHPDNEKNILAVAVLLMKAGELDRSIDIVKQGIIKKPNAYAYYALCGEIYFKQKQITKAENILRQYLALEDQTTRADKIKARINLAKLLMVQKKANAAEQLIDQVLEEDPRNIEAHHIKGYMYLAANNSDGAIANFRTVTREHPDHVDAYIGLAGAHALNRDYDLALDVLKSALKRAPESRPILSAMARMNILKKDPGAAEKNLKQIVELNPYNPDAIADLGDFYLSLNRCDEAVTQYDRIKNNKENAVMGYLKTARVLIRQDQLENAVVELQKGYQKTPDSPALAYALGQLYLKQGEINSAGEKFEEALAIEPRNQSAWLHLAHICEQRRDYRNAMEKYRQCLKHYPDSWMAANNLAFFLAELEPSGQAIAEALALAEKARGVKPDSPLIQDTLGWIYYKKGEFDHAHRFTSQALEALPENPEIYYHMGLIYHAQQMSEKAAAMLKQAVKGENNYLGKKEAVRLYNTYYK